MPTYSAVDRDDELYIQHYGILGMRWGIRKDRRARKAAIKRGRRAKPSKDYTRSIELRGRIKGGGTSKLSNKELRAAIDRINLERQYQSFTTKKPSQASKWGKAGLKKVGKMAGKAALGAAAVVLAKRGVTAASNLESLRLVDPERYRQLMLLGRLASRTASRARR